jgi:hypothetical protein
MHAVSETDHCPAGPDGANKIDVEDDEIRTFQASAKIYLFARMLLSALASLP